MCSSVTVASNHSPRRAICASATASFARVSFCLSWTLPYSFEWFVIRFVSPNFCASVLPRKIHLFYIRMYIRSLFQVGRLPQVPPHPWRVRLHRAGCRRCRGLHDGHVENVAPSPLLKSVPFWPSSTQRDMSRALEPVRCHQTVHQVSPEEREGEMTNKVEKETPRKKYPKASEASSFRFTSLLYDLQPLLSRHCPCHMMWNDS